MSFVEQSNYATQVVSAENISPQESKTSKKTCKASSLNQRERELGSSSFAEEKYSNFQVFINQLTERNPTLASLVGGQLPSLPVFMLLACENTTSICPINYCV